MATILLVDDNQAIQELITLRLKIAGHDIINASNGWTGYQKAVADKPDLVLLDMHMPIMDGHEAIQKLRKAGYDGFVVALTASAMVSETNKAINSGCNAVITKPIPDDFEVLVGRHLAGDFG